MLSTRNKLFRQTIYSFLELIEKRDGYTSGHSVRVAYYSTQIARALGLSKEEIELIYDSALLHDIGKIGIPDSILLKPGVLNETEYSIMKKHVAIGCETLNSLEFFSTHAAIIKDHHEKFDGSGYPKGKKGDEISLYSYILSIADSFDAMTTSRIYSKVNTPNKAVELLKKQDGIDFPPGLVDSLEHILSNQVIEGHKAQKPDDFFEEEKYAFHYKDSLTNLYSYTYLNFFVLENIKKHIFDCVYYINLKNFTMYNKEASWIEGDKFLIAFAKLLRKTFPKSKVFRIQGDDFLVITEKHYEIDTNILKHHELFTTTCVDVDIHHIDLRDVKLNSMKDFEELLFNQLGKRRYKTIKEDMIQTLNKEGLSYEQKISNINLDYIIQDYELFNTLIKAQDKELKCILKEKEEQLDELEEVLENLPIGYASFNENLELQTYNKEYKRIEQEKKLFETIKQRIQDELINTHNYKTDFSYQDSTIQIKKKTGLESTNYLVYINP